MKVTFVSITQHESMTPEQLLVYIARVSNPSNQNNTETADKLLGFLIKNKHWSPFDMVNMTVEVKTSRAIAQQILRHWSIKPQEFSQRYAEVIEIEDIELRKHGVTNRQSSEEVFDPEINIDCGNDVTRERASLAILDHFEYCKNLYKALLQSGVAKECARFVLPLATQTTLYLNGSIRSWIHYLEQRLDLHAQLEHRLVAQEILKIFTHNFPNISKSMLWSK